MKATFGAGCFWEVEHAFRRKKGVLSTQVGYSGGTKPNPTYEEVCSGTTGHTEVVELEYDPKRISYEELIDLFYTLHDPTALHKTQYRSVIFTHTSEQEKIATAKRRGHTSIEPSKPFYRAEEYHQCYFDKNK